MSCDDRTFYISLGTILLACAFLAYCGAAHAQCGSERRSVKTLQDNPLFTQTGDSTVSLMRSLPPPLHIPNALPRQPNVESTIWRLHALLIAWKIELNDHDYHLVLSDPNNPSDTMIAEIPSPSCVHDPKLAHRFALLRIWITQQTHIKSPVPNHLNIITPPLPLEIVGWGFFDKLHGQTGVAPNGIELHPVIQLKLEPAHGTQ